MARPEHDDGERRHLIGDVEQLGDEEGIHRATPLLRRPPTLPSPARGEGMFGALHASLPLEGGGFRVGVTDAHRDRADGYAQLSPDLMSLKVWMMSNAAPLHSARYSFLSRCRWCMTAGPPGVAKRQALGRRRQLRRVGRLGLLEHRLHELDADIAVLADQAHGRRLVAELRLVGGDERLVLRRRQIGEIGHRRIEIGRALGADAGQRVLLEQERQPLDRLRQAEAGEGAVEVDVVAADQGDHHHVGRGRLDARDRILELVARAERHVLLGLDLAAAAG